MLQRNGSPILMDGSRYPILLKLKPEEKLNEILEMLRIFKEKQHSLLEIRPSRRLSFAKLSMRISQFAYPPEPPKRTALHTLIRSKKSPRRLLKFRVSCPHEFS
jgi:hypothetical protein